MQVAALSHFQQNRAGVLAMFGAQAAIVGTAVFDFGGWIFGKGWSLGSNPIFKTLRASPDDGAKFSMLWTGLFEVNIPVT
jgi:hypothetical protein